MPKPVPTSEHFGGMNFKPCSSPPMETISNPKETSKPSRSSARSKNSSLRRM